VKTVSVARKISTIEERRKEHNCFAEEITGINVTNPKIVLSSSLGEDVGIGIVIVSKKFNDKHRMVWPVLRFRAIKIGKECRPKNLSNFLAVTRLVR
jgi:hypothetical protein